MKIKSIRSRFYKQHNDYIKFVIICSARTGSTLLHTLLNSHPQILSYGEVLRRQKEKKSEISLPFDRHVGKNIKAVGIKYHYTYQNTVDFDKVTTELVNNKNIKIIHLFREDIAAQLKSLKKAEQSGVWNSHQSPKRLSDITISAEEVKDFQRILALERNSILNRFSEHLQLEIRYEQLVSDSQTTLLEVQHFLGVSPKKLTTLLTKQS